MQPGSARSTLPGARPIQIGDIFTRVDIQPQNNLTFAPQYQNPKSGGKKDGRKKKTAPNSKISISIFRSQRCHIKDIEKFKPGGPAGACGKSWEATYSWEPHCEENKIFHCNDNMQSG